MTKSQIIKELTDEYVELNGRITSEFSACPEDMPDIMRAAREANKKLKELNSGWQFFPCETCSKHDPNYFIHCEISKF